MYHRLPWTNVFFDLRHSMRLTKCVTLPDPKFNEIEPGSIITKRIYWTIVIWFFYNDFHLIWTWDNIYGGINFVSQRYLQRSLGVVVRNIASRVECVWLRPSKWCHGNRKMISSRQIWILLTLFSSRSWVGGCSGSEHSTIFPIIVFFW